MILHKEFYSGGFEDPRVVKEAISLARSGYEVTIFCRNGRHDLPEKEQYSKDIFVRRISPKAKGRKKIMLLSKAVKKYRPDAIHCHDLNTLYIGFLAKISLGVPLVYDSHEDAVKFAKGYGTYNYLRACILQKLLVPFADGILAANEDIHRNFNPGKAMVVLNVPMVVENLAEKNESRNFRLIYGGGFHRGYGIEKIIKIPEKTDIELILLGGGTILEDIRTSVASSNCSERVTFIDAVPHNQFIFELSKFDAGIILMGRGSNNEIGTPNKLYDYMMAGLPIIASDLPGMRRVIESVGCGILVDPDDMPGLVKAVKHLAVNPAVRKEMAANGRRAAMEKYNWEKEGEKLVALYDGLVGAMV